MFYASRPETRENDVTVIYSAEIESKKARDSDAIVTVGLLRHVLALQHSVWNRENCQLLVHEVGVRGVHKALLGALLQGSTAVPPSPRGTLLAVGTHPPLDPRGRCHLKQREKY